MNRFRNLSINAKLVALSTAATASALAIACAIFIAYDYVTFRDALVRKLTAEAEIIGTNTASALVFRDPESARATLAALRAERHIAAAGVYTNDGILFASLGSARQPPERLSGDALRPLAYDTGGSELRVLQPIQVDGESVGAVVIWAGLDELRDRAVRYAATAIVVLMLAFGVAYFVSIWPKRMILEPIQELAKTARLVSENKDYSVRAQATSNDELGTMVEAFNEMLKQIEKRDAELMQARDSALEASRLKSAFLANMSHEIRTPLNIILGYNDLILDLLGDHGNSQATELFEPVRRASHRLLETIDGILDISKIETHQFPLDRRVLPLAPMIERQIQELRVVGGNVRLECVLREPKAAIVFDEYCLTHALMNLIGNALKFTVAGEVVVTLYRHPSGCLAIDVRDTGVGIDPNYLPKLFQAFSQEDSSYTRQFEGTGLGLALTKSYLELNDARIEVQSVKTKGSVFTIVFSAESEAHLESELAEEPRAAHVSKTAVPSDDQRHLILVVEDDEETRTLMREILCSHYAVAEAASGEEVRQRLAEHGRDVELVLMDLSLKGNEDGLQITRHLRGLSGWKTVPIVATTAHAFEEDRQRALAAGCDAFLAKPIQPQILLEMIRNYVGNTAIAT